MLYDTHCHINDLESFPDPADAIRSSHAAGATKLNIIGVDQSSCERAIQIAESHENVHAIVGLHPNYSADYSHKDLVWIEEMLGHPKCVALGEIGLDFHWDYSPLEKQLSCLSDQLDLAKGLGSPVVFHCRKAYPELLDLLEKRDQGNYLFHCFSGSRGDLERALQLGAMIGVDGPVTYKKSEDLRSMIASLPRDRLVLETDAPYLTPEPHRGKPNGPWLLPLIAEKIAEIWGMSVTEVAKITTSNAMKFFRLN